MKKRCTNKIPIACIVNCFQFFNNITIITVSKNSYFYYCWPGSSSFFGLRYSHRPATGTLEKDRVVTPEESGRVPEQTGDNRK